MYSPFKIRRKSACIIYIIYITVGLNNWLTVDTRGAQDENLVQAPPAPLQYKVCLFRLRLYVPVNIFFSHVGTFSWVESVLSNEDEVSCSGTQHCVLDEIRCRNLAI